jgi:hypothetical protein
MHTVTADEQKRIRIPDAEPGQVFAYDKAEDGTITLTQVKKSEPEPGKVKFIKEDGYTVGVTDRNVSLETIKELLAEFP